MNDLIALLLNALLAIAAISSLLKLRIIRCEADCLKNAIRDFAFHGRVTKNIYLNEFKDVWSFLHPFLMRRRGGSQESVLKGLLSIDPFTSKASLTELGTQLIDSIKQLSGVQFLSGTVVLNEGENISIISSYRLHSSRMKSAVLLELDELLSRNSFKNKTFITTHSSSLSAFGINYSYVLPFFLDSPGKLLLWLGFSKPLEESSEQGELFRLLSQRTLTILSQAKSVHDAKVRSDEEKNYILGLSHDLKAPGSTALCLVRDLKRRQHGHALSNQLNELEILLLEQLSLVSDFIDHERDKLGLLITRCEEIRLKDLFSELRDSPFLRSTKSDVHITTSPLEEIVVNFDKQHLKRIIVNLLSNALKFTECGSILLTAECRPNGSVAISVVDTGCGILPRNRKQLFEPFHLSSSPSGLGLGLSICRALAKRNGAILEYSKNIPQGSIFSIVVPKYLVHHSRSTKVICSDNGMLENSCTVLIAEDDDATARFYIRIVQLLGHTPIRVTCSAAIKAYVLSTRTISAIITDISLADGACTETLNEISELNALPPTIVVSGLHNIGEQFFNSSITIIEKPAYAEEVKNALISALSCCSESSAYSENKLVNSSPTEESFETQLELLAVRSIGSA